MILVNENSVLRKRLVLGGGDELIEGFSLDRRCLEPLNPSLVGDGDKVIERWLLEEIRFDSKKEPGFIGFRESIRAKRDKVHGLSGTLEKSSSFRDFRRSGINSLSVLSVSEWTEAPISIPTCFFTFWWGSLSRID